MGQTGIGNYDMGKTRISQLHIGALPGLAQGVHGPVEVNNAGVCETDAVVSLVNTASGYKAGGGFYCLG